ncbi:CRAL-TRIO lipid binding domain, partial [Trinorchestia longiramus]
TLPLEGHDSRGRKVIIVRSTGYDPNKFSIDEVMRSSDFIGSVMAEEEEQWSVTGVVQVVDIGGAVAAHAMQLTPAFVKKAMTIWQDGYPMRPKALHYINTPQSFDTVFNIFKSFMKEKMRKRVLVHGSDLSSLHQYIPPSMLPKEYGGTNGTVDDIARHWVKRVEAR